MSRIEPHWDDQFFNAHCHLELGHLRGAIPPGLAFTDWLTEVVRLKRATFKEQARAAVAAGLVEMRRTGTLAVADIDSIGIAPMMLRAAPESALSFTEMLNFDGAAANRVVETALQHQSDEGGSAPGMAFGLSPHSPYTTTARLIKAAAAAARTRDEWLCIHAAETPEENELLAQGTGPMREFLDSLGVLAPEWQPPRMRAVEYLASLGVLGPKTLLVHLNDVTDEELRLIADSQTRVVVCPGTHVYFNRGAFPLERLEEAGVQWYLGTDSLASNESLDMAREVHLAAELSPGVPIDRIRARASARRAEDFGL